MCTILTVDRATVDLKALTSAVYRDSLSNPDGFSVLTVDPIRQWSLTRATTVESVVAILEHTDWERCWIHARAATQGSVSLDNTHGWIAKGVVYFHNGCLNDPKADRLRVDSQLIGTWLHRQGPDQTLANLVGEYFANVLLVNPEESWWVMHRSAGGRLHTDGAGNYSTNPWGDITIPVQPYSYQVYTIDWDLTALEADPATTEEAV